MVRQKSKSNVALKKPQVKRQRIRQIFSFPDLSHDLSQKNT